jgi:uncharacterized protein (DUF2141 family)
MVSCAQIVAPTGGARDVTPPMVEKEYPANQSTSFIEEKISIKFDEYIQIKNADDQVVISPPMEIKPLFEVFGKTLEITLRSPLKPQTTYTLNFGNSIVDNHEGNILSGYTYVFSTGTSIDSFQIKGSIRYAFDLKPEKGMSVCLYSTDSFIDSTIYLNKPLYFSKTNDNGQFVLNNLPAQSFKLVAFKDDNKNLKYDKNEPIAFSNELVNSTDSLPIQTLYSFSPNLYQTNRLIDTFSNQIGKYTFVIYKPTDIAITPLEDNDYVTWYKKGKESLDTFTLISPFWKQGDSVSFIIKTDTEQIVQIKPRKSSKQGKLALTLPKEIDLKDSITISFNQPYETVKIDTNGIILKEDTLLVPFEVFYSAKKDMLKLYYPLKDKTKYSLEIKDSAVTDLYGGYNKREKTQFTTKGIKDYSNLNLLILPKKDSYLYLVQLIDEGDTRVFKQFIVNQKLTIPLTYVIPGKYRIKIIRDNNGNHKWDNGDYKNSIQPERVFYYSETLNLRAYWDLEQTIDLNLIVD